MSAGSFDRICSMVRADLAVLLRVGLQAVAHITVWISLVVTGRSALHSSLSLIRRARQVRMHRHLASPAGLGSSTSKI